MSATCALLQQEQLWCQGTLVHRNITLQVGPGSYSLLPARKVFSSTAPFASNTKRVFAASSSSGSSSHGRLEETKDGTKSPPAEQQGASASDVHSKCVPYPYRSTKSSCFASSTQRFTAKKETLAKPG
jgi:hypothetical protein